MDCLFCKIIEGTIPSKSVYQDDQCLAFHDIDPQAPVHVLVIPRKHIASLAEAQKEDEALLGHLLQAAAEVARTQGLVERLSHRDQHRPATPVKLSITCTSTCWAAARWTGRRDRRDRDQGTEGTRDQEADDPRYNAEAKLLQSRDNPQK